MTTAPVAMGRSANVATADCAPITKYFAAMPISA